MAGLLGGFDLPPWMFNFSGDLEENRPNAMLGGSPVQGVPNPMFSDRWQPAYDAAQSGQWFASDPSYPTPEQLAPRPGYPNSAPLPPPPVHPGANQYAGQSPAMGYAPEQSQRQPLANFPAQAPQQSGWDRFGQGINDNAMTLMGLGAGIAGGRGWGNGISQGLRMGMAGAASDRKQKNEASAQQAALQMVANATDITPQMKQALMRSPQLAQQYAEARIRNTGTKSTDIAEYEFAKAQGFKGTLEDWMKTVKQREVENFGLNPIPVLQDDGSVKYFQPGNRGSLKEMKPDGGGQITSKNAIKIDTATGTELYDPVTKTHLRTIPKDVQGAAKQKEKGLDEGKAAAALPQAMADAELTVETIRGIKNHPGKTLGTGPIAGRVGAVGGDQADFVERVGQLKGQSFVQGVQKMRGLGALTEREGAETLAAVARLSRLKKGPDFDAALDDIERLMIKGVNVMRQRAGQLPLESPTASPAAPAAASGAAPKTKAEYDALPRGAPYIAPDGSRRTKQ